jgi:inhibitor of KinA
MIAHRIYELNELSLTIEFGQEINPDVNDRVMALHHALQQDPFPGFVESVPAYTTLTVYYDLLLISIEKGFGSSSVRQFVSDKISEKLSLPAFTKLQALPVLDIPVCYDLSVAPDLPWVAEYCRLTIPEIIDLHSRETYRVYMIGFIPGFPYLGMLPPALEVPRKIRPALSVAAGSVALAGRQTGIYPFSIPGGWQVIGRTPYGLFDVNRDPCCSLEAGQKIRFVPITLEEFKERALS